MIFIDSYVTCELKRILLFETWQNEKLVDSQLKDNLIPSMRNIVLQ